MDATLGRRDAVGLAGAVSLGIAASALPRAAAAASVERALGGSDESDGGALSDPFTFAGTTYRSRTYLTSGRFVVTGGTLDVAVVLVGGGGGGGWGCGGGGGQVRTGLLALATGAYAVTVGPGGEGAAEYFDGGQGGASSFDTGGAAEIAAAGGGGGFADPETFLQVYRGGPSGSGAFHGGDVAFGPDFRFRGGGGGGAGGFGADGDLSGGGGSGGNSVYVSGFDVEELSLGGGGGGWDSAGEGPVSAGVGAGDGGFGPYGEEGSPGSPGSAGSGGGGGGGAGRFGVATGAAGGSGRVVVRYRVA
jgi:hypothetical protein